MTVYQTQADDPQKKIVVFAGGTDAIEFVAPMLVHLGQGGLYRIRVKAADGQMRVRWRPYLPGDPTAGEERKTVLLESVSNVEWAYFGPERDDDQEPHWRSEWANQERRPLLVRLNLILRGESWPDLVVALAEGPSG